MIKDAVKIKVCGLRKECDIDYVNELKPDYIGFIFAKDRRRYITPEQALKLRNWLDSSIISVGVFVNESEEVIVDIVKSKAIGMIQLHGTESEEFIASLREKVDIPIIKAFTIKSESDIENAKVSSADFILLDNGIGGTGESFNWSLIRNIGRPYFLAGGLSEENIETAISDLNPFAVDVSSAVETDGYKDYNKIKNFIEKVRL
ncbi:MAG: phosphoribosylanthranilate isomerase [Faecalibacterium sp.]|nr:phosphoribosylanthranilate isomerase [Ruminococcus sp.]MCM1391989.1 phosphoribosylanthranilate isomerase [Ruminococcus sp.]MCM1485580.1 phosphoribosylanthranilate isomerase [Faecalibacterium sp.]